MLLPWVGAQSLPVLCKLVTKVEQQCLWLPRAPIHCPTVTSCGNGNVPSSFSKTAVVRLIKRRTKGENVCSEIPASKLLPISAGPCHRIIEPKNDRLDDPTFLVKALSRQDGPGTLPSWILNVFSVRESTASQGRSFQWLIAPTGKNVPLVVKQNSPRSNFYLLPLILSIGLL